MGRSRLDERNMRTVIKGKGSLEDSTDGSERAFMNNYGGVTWNTALGYLSIELIRSVVVCYGVSSISNNAFESLK